MFCRFCGKEIAGAFDFCPYCGKSLIVHENEWRASEEADGNNLGVVKNKAEDEECQELLEEFSKPILFDESDAEEKSGNGFVLKDNNLPIPVPKGYGYVAILLASILTTFFCISKQIISFGALVIFSVFFLLIYVVETTVIKKKRMKKYVSAVENLRFRCGKTMDARDSASILKMLGAGNAWNVGFGSAGKWEFSRYGRRYEVSIQKGEFSVKAGNKRIYKTSAAMIALEMGSLAYATQFVSFDGMPPKSNIIQTFGGDGFWTTKKPRIFAVGISALLWIFCFWRGYQADQIATVQGLQPYETSDLNWQRALEKYCSTESWSYYRKDGEKYVSFSGMCNAFGDNRPHDLNILWKIEDVDASSKMIYLDEIEYNGQVLEQERGAIICEIFDLDIMDEAAARQGENPASGESTDLTGITTQPDGLETETSGNAGLEIDNTAVEANGKPAFRHEQVCGMYLQVIDELAYSVAKVDYNADERKLHIQVDCYNGGGYQYGYSADLTFSGYQDGMDYYYDEEFPMYFHVKPGYLELALDEGYELPTVGNVAHHMYIFNVEGVYYPTTDAEIERVNTSSGNAMLTDNSVSTEEGEFERIDMDFFDVSYSGSYRNVYSYLTVTRNSEGALCFSGYSLDIDSAEMLEYEEGVLRKTGANTYESDDGQFVVSKTDSGWSFGSNWAWCYFEGPFYKVDY